MIINVLREKWKRKAKIVAVRESATNKFLEQWRKDIDKSVWRPGNCNSWYQRASSKIYTNEVFYEELFVHTFCRGW